MLPLFRRLLGKPSLEQDLSEEFEAHLALESQILRERGLSREEAAVQARRTFGNRSLLAEQAREPWVLAWFDRVSQDLRYAVRTLRKSSAFAPAAVLSIALGVGAGTAVYSIADTVFLRPLPYSQPNKLMWVGVRFPKATYEFLGSPDYVAWRRDNRAFENLAATQVSGGGPILLNGENAREVHNARVSANFLKTFGIAPELGRDFTAEEELPDGPRAVLLTDRLWEERFHRDAGIVGKSIRMDGIAYTVIGVLPRSFVFPADIQLDVLTTLPVSPTASWRDRSASAWAIYGKLKPGVSMARARTDLQRLFEQSKAGNPMMFRPGSLLVLEPLQQHRVGDARKLLAVLIGAVTRLLLIACANVSNLLLARWSARSGELAIRAAIGAGRARLARQLLTEAALLTLAGCALGALLAFGVLRGFVHFASNELPRMSEVAFDGRVFGIGLVLALFTTLIFGGLPALQSGRLDIQTTLQHAGRFGLAAGSRFARRILIVGEVGLCLTLLCGAALLLETLWHLRNDRLGFEPERVLNISIPIKGTKLETGNRDQLVDELLEFIRHIPGTEDAAQTECTPLSGGSMGATFARADRPLPEPFHPGDSIQICGTGAGYAEAAGLRVLRGRFFSDKDFDHPNTLAVINETAARTYFAGEDAVGKQILGGPASRGATVWQGWKTIVGVVSDSKNVGLDEPPAAQAYVNGMAYPESTQLQIIVRSIADQQGLETAISGRLRSLDSGLMANFEPLDETISEMSGGARFNAILVGSFALIAFLMAVVGVYGVLAFAVTQRTQEIGIRLALGGTKERIFGLMLREGMWPVVFGIGGGVVAVFALTRYLKAMLYGVSATDPITFVAVAVGLALAAGAATAIPARRATRVDPMIALRHQ